MNVVRTDNNANVTTNQKTQNHFDDNSSEFSSELEEVYEQFSKLIGCAHFQWIKTHSRIIFLPFLITTFKCIHLFPQR